MGIHSKTVAIFTIIFLAMVVSYTAVATPKYEYKGVHFTQLSENVWMHTSYKNIPNWGNVLTNGLIIINEKNTTLIDTAWDNTQTLAILEWVHKQLKTPITQAVFTHAHQDKMGGVDAIKAQGIATYAHPLSNKIAPTKGLSPAENNLSFNTSGESYEISPLIIYYPGPGHTGDNITVAIPEKGIVFAGCLLRPAKSVNLGNTADADLSEWESSVIKLKNRFPNAGIIIPSHGEPSGRNLFSNTSKLAHEHSHNHE